MINQICQLKFPFYPSPDPEAEGDPGHGQRGITDRLTAPVGEVLPQQQTQLRPHGHPACSSVSASMIHVDLDQTHKCAVSRGIKGGRSKVRSHPRPPPFCCDTFIPWKHDRLHDDRCNTLETGPNFTNPVQITTRFTVR